MKAFDHILNDIRAGMYQTNMHACMRDKGAEAGGYLATGSLTQTEVFQLGEEVVRLADDKTLAASEWSKHVEFGKDKPLYWNENQRTDGPLGGRALNPNEKIKAEIPKVVDTNYIQDVEVEEPSDDTWNPVEQVDKYLSTLFSNEDNVGYVTESWFNEKAGKHLPQRGCYDRTAGQLLEELHQKKDLRPVFGDYNPDVGAWIRFNPLDGVGVKDENVTAFRYALVESDVVEIPRQRALMKELKLPIATLVHSGGKSLHAVVRIDAENMKEYRERVDHLYEVCARNGLAMDRQNRNPSRLSRMPGVIRNGKKQFLLETNTGMENYKTWRNWIEDAKDDLPDFESDDDESSEPELDEEMIEGVLRKGHKLLLSGPSKAGKSFCLQQLALAVATGTKWLGWKVKQGKVLYVNLELAAKSNKHRFWNIKRKLKLKSQGNIDFWNLRGNAVSMDRLAPKIIRRAEEKGYSMIIIDPIYKVLTGDENSAQEMAHFCNQFDRIAVGLGVTVVYAHHHSKGAQGQKSSRDRSSGSGVFARDPDAIIDMIELVIDEGRRKAIVQRWYRDALHRAFTGCGAWGWEEVVERKLSQDDALLPDKLVEVAQDEQWKYDGEAVNQEIHSAEIATAWRIEGTLREFAGFKPRDIFFKYPLHIVDNPQEPLLADAMPESAETSWKRGQDRASGHNDKQEEKANKKFAKLFQEVAGDRTEVWWKELETAGAGNQNTIKKRCNAHPRFTYETVDRKAYVKLVLETTEIPGSASTSDLPST